MLGNRRASPAAPYASTNTNDGGPQVMPHDVHITPEK